MVGGTCVLITVFQVLLISVYLWDKQITANGYEQSFFFIQIKIYIFILKSAYTILCRL